jgi:polysaccharide export outer membrane protein
MKNNALNTFLALFNNTLRYFGIFLIVLNTASCGNSNTIRPESSIQAPSGVSNEKIITERDAIKTDSADFKTNSDNEKRNALLLEQAMKAPRQGDYILGPDDVIDIDVFEVDELKRTARISSTGFIKLPLVGEVKAAGLTVQELETEIGNRLDRYLQEPIVSIFIKEYRSQRITVLGAVKSPQAFTVTQQKFLLDMLSLAQGLSGDAGDICYVQRGGETIIVNLNELLIKGNAQLNIPVFADDVINIPQGGVVFVNGYVKGPGSFPMKGTVTLTQVIAMAKGLNYEANGSDIRVYRNSGTDSMEIITVDYDAILDKKIPDMALKDKDIVIVPANGIKNFFSGFVKAVSGTMRLGGGSVSAAIP